MTTKSKKSKVKPKHTVKEVITVDSDGKPIPPLPPEPETELKPVEKGSISAPVDPRALPQNLLKTEGRRAQVVYRHVNGLFNVVRIRNGGDTDYFVRSITGLVFLLTKLEANTETTYRCSIGKVRSCGCPWFTEKRTGSCKHLEALEALRNDGRI